MDQFRSMHELVDRLGYPALAHARHRPNAIVVEDEKPAGLHLRRGGGDVAPDPGIRMVAVDIDPVEEGVREGGEPGGAVALVDGGAALPDRCLEVRGVDPADVELEDVQVRGGASLEDARGKIAAVGADLGADRAFGQPGEAARSDRP